MDVRIGIAQSGQVIEIEMEDDTDRSALKAEVDAVLADDGKILWLTDRRGKETGVPGDRISFVELGEEDAERRIGFGA